jgi:excisionase family DNA binding protein
MPRSELESPLDRRPQYTTEELGELLRLTDRAVRRLIDEGKIHAVRVGRYYRIPAGEVDRVLREGT